MRKQYHSRRSNGHLLIWDVDRLVDLARGLSVIEVPLTRIGEIDEPYWFPADDPAPTCRAILEHVKLIDAADLMYPIILCPQGRVMDGMHRVGRAVLLGLMTIGAYQFRVMPSPDYVDVPLESLTYDRCGNSS
jgi:hypothetical protein